VTIASSIGRAETDPMLEGGDDRALSGCEAIQYWLG
jgi:hypothetical protein